MSRLQMIIVLRHELSHGACIVAVSHASLGTYLTFENDPIMQEWRKTSFVKVIKQAMNDIQFQAIRKLGLPHRVFTESKLDNMEVSVGFLPMLNPPIILKDVPLYKG
jgi:peptidyl-tRNA hydrolase